MLYPQRRGYEDADDKLEYVLIGQKSSMNFHPEMNE
jgi:hypothetical protein